MGKFIRIGAGALVQKDGQNEGLGGLVQVEEERAFSAPESVVATEQHQMRSEKTNVKCD